MKAIMTRFHGPTDTKGSRYSASDADGNRVMVQTDFSVNSEGNHDRAAIALCNKMNWKPRKLVRGGWKHGNCYVFDGEHERVEVKS